MIIKFSHSLSLLCIGILFSSIISCNNQSKESTVEIDKKDTMVDNNSSENSLKPTGAVPDWGPSIKPEMQVVMEKLVSMGGKPAETLDAKEARMQPTPKDAVMAVIKEKIFPFLRHNVIL